MNPEELNIPKLPRVEIITDFGVKRLIVVGDIHGCVVEMAKLLDTVRPTPDDLLIFVGDLVDRGPASVVVAETVRELCLTRPKTFCVLGNHEEKHIRYRRHMLKQRTNPGYKNPMKMRRYALDDHNKMSDDLLKWLAELPAVVGVDMAQDDLAKRLNHEPRVPGIRLITHAGLVEGWLFNQPTKALIRNRYLIKNADGKWEATGDNWVDNRYVRPEGSILWDEAWAGPRVIYGHIVYDEPRINNDCYGIDTGAVFGGRLTAYVETLATGDVELVSVDAERQYFSTNSENMSENDS